MEYKVITCKAVKTNKVLELENENGVLFKDVFVNSKFDDQRTTFEGIREGSMLIGDITTSDWNGKEYKWLNSAKPQGSYNNGTSKSKGIAQAQERKEQSIYASQERKSEDIKISSTFRDATIITAALMANEKGMPQAEILGNWKKTWVNTRKWLYDNYENFKGYPDDLPDGDAPW